MAGFDWQEFSVFGVVRWCGRGMMWRRCDEWELGEVFNGADRLVLGIWTVLDQLTNCDDITGMDTKKTIKDAVDVLERFGAGMESQCALLVFVSGLAIASIEVIADDLDCGRLDLLELRDFVLDGLPDWAVKGGSEKQVECWLQQNEGGWSWEAMGQELDGVRAKLREVADREAVGTLSWMLGVGDEFARRVWEQRAAYGWLELKPVQAERLAAVEGCWSDDETLRWASVGWGSEQPGRKEVKNWLVQGINKWDFVWAPMELRQEVELVEQDVSLGEPTRAWWRLGRGKPDDMV